MGRKPGLFQSYVQVFKMAGMYLLWMGGVIAVIRILVWLSS